MLDEYLISDSAKESIKRFLEKPNGGLIISGPRGLGKYHIARYIAEHILHDRLEGHPDFYEVTSVNRVIKLDQLDNIKYFISNMAAKGDRKVFIIDDADSMTESSQNSMLKILEDCNETNTIILVSHSKLIPTICSRCSRLSIYEPYGDTLNVWLEKKGERVDELAIALAGNKPAVYYSMRDKKDFLIVVRNFFDSFAKRSVKDMMISLNLMKEKDKNNFFEKYEIEDIRCFFDLILNVLVELQCRYYSPNRSRYNDFVPMSVAVHNYKERELSDIRRIVAEHYQMSAVKGQYTKNNFFDLIRSI